MSGDGPVRRYEFDLFRAALEQRLAGIEERQRALERDVERLEDEHEQDMDKLATADRERRTVRREDRKWTVGQVIAAVGAAAALGAFWLAAIGR